ncbi:catalase [Aeromicrobium terrae]|uniref:Catalase n=1 Tax=Aeromicrobium terrae TaxID=2498846 RepID=A0A5C8NKG4_9ACTN|nr:catalase [Aeromicrobium terrae]TXL62259.1 catalase [Aeromicrobium terrae]
MTTPEEALEKIHARFGAHAGHRVLHAKGVHCTATFTATPEAASICRAAHLSGETVEAKVRFSNGGGDPTVPDYAPDVRGLAVSWVLPDGSRTDLLAQTLPYFPSRDVDGFFAALAISKPGLGAALRLPSFVAKYPTAVRRFPETNKALNSRVGFAARRYFPFHAFRFLDADGGSRFVRYAWLPLVDEPEPSKAHVKALGRDYLFDDLRDRLEQGPVRMLLAVQLAGEGDDPDDPSAAWPHDPERRVELGTLEVTAIDDDADDGIIFDPMRLTDGIEATDDLVLRYRPDVYSLSYARRTQG